MVGRGFRESIASGGCREGRRPFLKSIPRKVHPKVGEPSHSIRLKIYHALLVVEKM